MPRAGLDSLRFPEARAGARFAAAFAARFAVGFRFGAGLAFAAAALRGGAAALAFAFAGFGARLGSTRTLCSAAPGSSTA